jgi:hypothetical protein
MIESAWTRFELRETCDKFTQLIFQTIDEILQRDEEIFDNFSVCLLYDGDLVYIDDVNGKEMRNQSMPIVSDLLNDLNTVGLFDLTIKVETLSSHDDKDVDGYYTWPDLDTDDVGFYDNGGIELFVKVPKHPRDYREKASLISCKVRGALAHELQHMIQRVLLGQELNTTPYENIVNHMRDVNEIDARIEEALAYPASQISIYDVDQFVDVLREHTKDYLVRNGIDVTDARFDKYLQEMLDTHTIAFRKKFEIWG